ncbi:hypothetical protein O181_025131 [Austropuccinia psidii MF-1]|uniref:Uncharacterized protein n=1 Tax=Austropuccinia psidii MF-1 TaxID=1389203 RepID=A0A9Q3CHZ1_9BASI|nr:hypothetical protein [Austropuccinia psidii MF-1]
MARGVPSQDALVRTPLWSMMMKAFPSGNGHQDPKQADRNNSRKLAWCPQVLTCPPPLLGHHPIMTSLSNKRKVIIWPTKHGDGKRKFELGPIVTITKPTKSAKTRGSHSLYALRAKSAETYSKPKWHPMVRGLILQLPPPAPKNQTASSLLAPSSPQSENEAFQEFTNLKPTFVIPRAIVHKSINQILLEHCHLLQIIPFMDETHLNEMHQEFWEELNSICGQALEAYPKEDITGIVSRFLVK